MNILFCRFAKISAFAALLSSVALSGHANSVSGTLPVQVEPAGSNWDTVVADAAAQSTGASSGGTLIYRSTKMESTVLEGDFTADAHTTSLAIFSDDGCDVTVDGSKIWTAQGKGQALADLPNSLHALKIRLTPGQTYHIKIDYSNIIHTGSGDADGATLFAFSDTSPAVTMTADDFDDVDQCQQVTSKVYAKVDHLPAGHFASDLTATWTWSLVGVTHSNLINGSFTTEGVDRTLFSLAGDNSDLVSPKATFQGEFDLEGYYEVEAQASVKYHDNRTGEDLGPYGPGDVYVGGKDDPSSEVPSSEDVKPPSVPPVASPKPQQTSTGPQRTVWDQLWIKAQQAARKSPE